MPTTKRADVPKRIGKELYKSIFAVQQEAPIFEKTKAAHNYKYVQLTTIWKEVRPLLKKHKLLIMQLPEGANLKTIIMHIETNDYHELNTLMPEGYELSRMNLFQSYGSSLTYYKRYVLCSFLGIFTEDEDNDAQGKAEKKYTKKVIPSKATLNEQQFIRMLGAINAGDFKKDEALKQFDLSEKQIEDLNRES